MGIGGVAIGPTTKYLSGEIIKEGSKIIAKTTYQRGGFCQYELSELNLQFIQNKHNYFWTRVSILSKREWSGGYLDFSELTTNQNSNLEVICRGKKQGSFPECVTLNDGNSYGRGNLGNLYLWRENLRDIDAYNGGKLIL